MRVGRENVEAKVILLVWFIPITYAYLETLAYMARNGDIQVLAPYHGVGIGIRTRMKDRIWANSVRVYGTDSVAGKGKRIGKIKLPISQLSFQGRCVDAEIKTVQTASAGTLPGIGDRVLRKSALNDSAWGSGRVGQEMRKVPIREAVRLSRIAGIKETSVLECMRELGIDKGEAIEETPVKILVVLVPQIAIRSREIRHGALHQLQRKASVISDSE